MNQVEHDASVQRIYIEYQDETLLIDRKEGSFEYAKRKDSKKFFYHLYQDKESVVKLLDYFGEQVDFSNQLQGASRYRLTIDYLSQPQKIVESPYEPTGWAAFLSEIEKFISFHNDGQLIPAGFERNSSSEKKKR
ncbi:hypothetical protein [Jeotgalibaca dankookensis]|uniref:hypothetical protein n=1 Tax=Jeotgalibaca dankookensis TaxID=708126 RepID=UPI000782CBA1|nr:hypothetical protein [Jeotgalibaca dankookensis]